jgi:hypothetical protein
MMFRIPLIILLLIGFLHSFSQKTIIFSGVVKSQIDSVQVSQASVLIQKISGGKDTQIVAFGFTKSKGVYEIKTNLPTGLSEVFITMSHIAYERKTEKCIFSFTDSIVYKDFFLLPSKNQLKEIIIEDKNPVRVKKDTVVFIADSFRTAQTRKVEDLIKNIEGFKVEADGRITFRGKEVKALLIDGDDLTQDQYQLLTRNLNADVVDRVQVIDNYNKNRIMGDLMESNQAAINLKLKKGMQGKLNGSASAAGSVEGRYEGDATLVWLKSKFKMVGLLNTNNVSKDATGLLRYQEFGSQGSLQQREELTKKLVNGPGIISTGSVIAPDISREYVLDNRNQFASPLLHFRLSKSIKLAVRTYAVKDRLSFNGNNSSSTVINETTRWDLLNTQFSNKERTNVSTAIELSHDNLKKFAGNLNIQAGYVTDRHLFNNQTSGFFQDTLRENLMTERTGIAAIYSGATKVNDKTVFNIQSNFSYLPEQSNFMINTNRLHLFYNVKDSFRLFHQSLNTKLVQWQSIFSFFGKRAKGTIRFGIESNWQHLNTDTKIKGLDSVFITPARLINFFENRAIVTALKQLSGKSSIRFDGSSGIGLIKNDEEENRLFPLWKASVSYKYKIKAFSGFNMSVGASKELPNLFLFHPQGLLSANASVKNGSRTYVPLESFNASLSFADFKIMSKYSLLAGINARYAKTDYTVNNVFVPQYTVADWDIVKDNRQVGANFDIGSFVFPLNSTFRLSSNANYSISNQLQNNIAVENRFLFGSFMITWVPNFKWPVGWEINFSKNYFQNKQVSENFENRNSNQTTNLLLKLRSKFKGNYYIGTQYNYLQLSPSQQFQLWSLFQNLVINNKMNIDLAVHNLLNKRLYSQQINSPNSQAEFTFTGIGRYFLLRYNISF